MRSSGTTTIFSGGADQTAQPMSFAASIFVHGAVMALVWFVIAYKPPFVRVVTEHYAVRRLDLQMDEMAQAAANARIPSPKPASAHGAAAPAGGSAPSPVAPAPLAQAKIGPQTLIQPDINKPILLSQEIPLPQVVIWTPGKTQVKVITPPPPKPVSSDVKPSVVQPNQEMNIADVNVTSSFKPSPKSIIQASTTSPVQIHLAEKTEVPPATVAQPTLQPTPAQIMSLSPLRASSQTVALPPVNESKASKTEGTLAGTELKSPATQNNPDAKTEGSGNGQNPAAKTNSSANGAGQLSKNGDSGTSNGSNAGTNSSNNPGPPSGNASQSRPGADSGSDQPVIAGATKITVPRDGRFVSVIVGDSLQDRYPEIAQIWSGRLTYTAYLHVGLAKNWILQYSLPRASDAARGGNVARLDAPWPYNIVRPNLEPGSMDADALMIHGFVNQSGRFETLSVLFPEAFPKAQFVLAALQQWQFRPASQDGQPARVEVLLIIPEEYE